MCKQCKVCEWLNMDGKEVIKNLESSEYMQVDAELNKNESIEVLNNLDSLVMVTYAGNKCCVCGKMEMDGVKPTFRRVEVQEQPFPHWHCKVCFIRLICVSFWVNLNRMVMPWSPHTLG